MKKRGLAMLLAMFFAMGITACSKGEVEQTKVLIAVEAQEVQKTSLKRYTEVSSQVLPKNQVQVIPKIAGTVKKVNVSLGDEVRKGDVLFVIDDSDLRLQVDQAEATVNSARANYHLNVEGNLKSQIQQLESSVASYEVQYADLLKNLEDMKQLYEAGAVSKAELDRLIVNADTLKLQLDTAKKSLELSQNNISSGTKEVAEAAVAQANAGLKNVKNQLNHTQVKAEIGGVVNSLSVSEGMVASPQVPAMTISDISEVKLSFQVSQEAITKIGEGTLVYVDIPSLFEEPIRASVTNLSRVADNRSLLYPVEVLLENSKGSLKPGMFATAKIILEKKDNVLAVPIDAVIQKEEREFVYLVDEKSIVHEVDVVTGIQNDESIEILSGLSEGMKIVVRGQDFISNGSEVNLVSSEE